MLFLFDIDGTLISPGPAPRKAINQAIESHTGITPNLQIKDVAGLTDRLIVKNALLRAGMTENLDETISKIVANYLEMMEKDYIQSDGAIVYEDAVRLVEKVISKGHSIGLLTGNMLKGAQIKLGKFDLMKHFPFGAYADDGETRNDLPIVAKQRAEINNKRNYNFDEVVLVGDTVEDAMAAKFSGCKSIIVCRRPEWYNDIVNAGADLVVYDLDDPIIDEVYQL